MYEQLLGKKGDLHCLNNKSAFEKGAGATIFFSMFIEGTSQTNIKYKMIGLENKI